MEYRKGLIFMLIAFNIIVALYLSYAYAFNIQQFCLTGGGCDAVQNSSYSKFFGIPTAYLGVTAFIALFLVYLLTYKNKIKSKLFLASTIIGLIGAIYLFSIQAFVLKEFCSNCLATEIVIFIISAVAFYDHFKSIKH